MLTEKQAQLDNIFVEISKTLDISPSDFKKAQTRYNAVGQWLEDGYKPNSADNAYPQSIGKPQIYLQGSMRLGTVVRPLKEGKDSDFDIDLVCELSEPKSTDNHASIKEQVGDRLKSNDMYKDKLDEEGKRCWTLEYAKDTNGIGFHLDILPCCHEDPDSICDILLAGGEQKYTEHSVAITNKDNEIYNWKPSNPQGYAQWFDEVKQPAFNEIVELQQNNIYENNKDIFSSKEEIPNELVRTPLQRAIQIMKRHRDIRFAGNAEEKYKPISIIITTLAAKLYQNEEDVYTTLTNIVSLLNRHASLLTSGAHIDHDIADQKLIERTSDGYWYIKNPVNPLENFADRWDEDNDIRARTFFKWVSWLKDDIDSLLYANNLIQCKNMLVENFGESNVNNAFANIGENFRKKREDGSLKVSENGLLGAIGATVTSHTFFGK